jgi:hypothetical protein
MQKNIINQFLLLFSHYITLCKRYVVLSINTTLLVALVHCLIAQETSLNNFTQCNDPTLTCLYTKIKNILGDHIHDNENSIHVLKSACAQPKSECYKAKAALENQDQPAGVRIEIAVNILNNVIAYVDEIAQKRYLEDPLSDFQFAEQQVENTGPL